MITKIIVAGAKYSGKSTFLKILKDHLLLKKITISLEEVGDLEGLIGKIGPDIELVMVDSGLLTRAARITQKERRNLTIKQIEKDDLLINHLTKFPNLRIINNNDDIASLRVRTKKLLVQIEKGS